MPPSLPQSPRPRVVVIDDSAVLLKWAESALKPDFVVATTSSVTALPSLIAYSGRPTIVLVDINMPGWSGTDVVRGLADTRFADIWFYLFSGMPEQQASVLARDCGADGFIAKTGKPEELRASLHAAFAQRSRRCILVAGSDAARLIPDRAALDRAFDVLELRSVKIVLQQLALRPPHVIIGSGPLIDGRPEDLYGAVRRTSATRRLSIVHVTTSVDPAYHEQVQRAGANLVLTAKTPAAAFNDAIAKLASVAPRRDVRVPLGVKLKAGAGGIRGTTRNVSVSGLLATFEGEVEIGSEVALEFTLPGRTKITVATRVVRGPVPEHGQYAYGLQFTSLRDEDFDAIAAYVAEHL